MKCILFFLSAIILYHHTIYAQNDLNVISGWIQFSDAPNSLYHDLADQAYTLLEKREEKIASLKSLNDWQKYQEQIKKTLLDIVGPFPERTPLNAKVLKTINKEGFQVEQIVFESQPGFFVTSSLFIPAGLPGKSKSPAIIYCSGHTDDAYRNKTYQQAILNLVKKKFIVFAFDPIGQGERLEYYDPQTGKSIIGERDQEHSYAGAQPFICGSSLARYMVWDGIRAVDYLLTRKEVDPGRIGITGRSGGGTQSAYIAAFDNRIQAVAPGNYITNFRRLIESAGPQDAEQDFFNGIERGIDMADLLLVRAPKPALINATTRDQIFNIHGTMETAKEVSRIYEAYNQEENFGMVTDDAGHVSTKKGREGMYGFFQKNLGNPGNPEEDEVTLLSPEELQVSRTGQVSTSFGSETVFTLNKKASEKLEQELQLSRQNILEHRKVVLESAKRLSGYKAPVSVNKPVFTGRFQRDGYVLEKYFVKGEGNYIIPYLLMKPEHSNHHGLIYLNPKGKSVDAQPGGDMEWFAKKGFTVLAPDLLGFGEMGPGIFQGDSYIKGVSYNVWFVSMLIGRSISGIQAGDVVRLKDLLKEQTGVGDVYGLAKKEMSPVMLHAAVFDTSISRVALIEPYSSYRSLVENRFYNPAYIHSAVPGALELYDLPDLGGLLAPRKLTLLDVKDGKGTIITDEKDNDDISIIKSYYHRLNTDDQLDVEQTSETIHERDILSEWLK